MAINGDLTRWTALAAVLFISTAPMAALAHDDHTDDVDVELDEGSSRSYVGDANSSWFHVGGSWGATTGRELHEQLPAGRFILGGGRYTFGFYSTGGLEVTASRYVRSVGGYGGLGVHIPIPVVHPLFGFKIGGGLADLAARGPSPMFMIGGQAGIMLREYDGRIGLRLMIEPCLTAYPFAGTKGREVFVSLALVL